MLLAHVKASFGLWKRHFSCRAVGLLALFNSSSAPQLFFDDKWSASNKRNGSQLCRKNPFLKKRDSFVGSKMHKQYGKIKYMLLFFMEKICYYYICQIKSVCQKVEESGRGWRKQFYLSSILLLCIYLALENAKNVFSFRLGPFAKPQKDTG